MSLKGYWTATKALHGESRAVMEYPSKGDFIGKDGRQHSPKGRKRPRYNKARGELVIGTP